MDEHGCLGRVQLPADTARGAEQVNSVVVLNFSVERRDGHDVEPPGRVASRRLPSPDAEADRPEAVRRTHASNDRASAATTSMSTNCMSSQSIVVQSQRLINNRFWSSRRRCRVSGFSRRPKPVPEINVSLVGRSPFLVTVSGRGSSARLRPHSDHRAAPRPPARRAETGRLRAGFRGHRYRGPGRAAAAGQGAGGAPARRHPGRLKARPGGALAPTPDRDGERAPGPGGQVQEPAGGHRHFDFGRQAHLPPLRHPSPSSSETWPGSAPGPAWPPPGHGDARGAGPGP